MRSASPNSSVNWGSDMPKYSHKPVLLNEVLTYLNPQPGDQLIDGTVGHGGHANELVARVLPGGTLLAIDRDERNLAFARETLAPHGRAVTFIHDSYANLASHAYEHGMSAVAGILLDLGFSSAHVEDAARGFSFQSEGPLDMRYDTRQELSAATIVNGWSAKELAQIFHQYGEERHAHKIADAIVRARRKERILTTLALADLVASVRPRQGKMHPATRVFQALRIAVNDELGELERALPQMVSLLKPGGRLAVISFHSLEDRVVKAYFKAHDRKELRVLTKHVVTPGREEQLNNPRSRSAKLRVAERL